MFTVQESIFGAQTRKEGRSFEGIAFTREGWKQFCMVNRVLGVRYIRAFVLRHELAQYITAHEKAGKHLDTECQEIRYDSGVYLVLRRMQGIWYITDVIAQEPTTVFRPLYVWQCVREGIRDVIARVLCRWTLVRGRKAEEA